MIGNDVKVYNRQIEKHPVIYGEGPLWIMRSPNLINWARDEFVDVHIPKVSVLVNMKNYIVWNVLRISHWMYKNPTLKVVVSKLGIK